MNLTVYWVLSVVGLLVMYLLPKLSFVKDERVANTIKIIGILISGFAIIVLIKNGVL